MQIKSSSYKKHPYQKPQHIKSTSTWKIANQIKLYRNSYWTTYQNNDSKHADWQFAPIPTKLAKTYLSFFIQNPTLPKFSTYPLNYFIYTLNYWLCSTLSSQRATPFTLCARVYLRATYAYPCDPLGTLCARYLLRATHFSLCATLCSWCTNLTLSATLTYRCMILIYMGATLFY